MSKIKIFSIHASRTDFLELQYNSFRHFLEEEFEYYCIDNFIEAEKSLYVKQKANELGVNYIKFDSYQLHGNAFDHAPALNSIKTITTDDCINVIVDFDLFLISNFSISKYIDGYDISGIYQQRNNFELEYLAPFLVIVNSNKNFSSIDFDSNKDILSDVGGNTSFFLKSKNVKLLKHTSALNKQRDQECFNIEYDISFGCQIIESAFIHYYRGTNWDQNSLNYHERKTSWLRNVLNNSKTQDILNLKYLEKYQNIFSHAFEYWNGSNEKFNSILNPYLYYETKTH